MTSMDYMLFHASGGDDESSHLAEVKDLLKRGANPNFVSPVTGDTPLINAVRNNNIEIAKTLIASGADVNYGRVFLNARTAKSLELLLAAGLDPMSETFGGESLLEYTLDYYAGTDEYLTKIKLLLQYGAVPHAWYMTNTHLVEEHEMQQDQRGQRGQALQMLLDAGADVDEPNPNGRTGLQQTLRRYRHSPLKKGTYPKKLPVVKTYIDNGATLDPAWLEGLFHPDDEAQILADAAFARRRHLIILREYLKSIGQVPGSSKGSKFFPSND